MIKSRLDLLNIFFKRMRGKANFETLNDARRFIQFRITIKKWLTDSFLIILGILAAGFGLKGFLLPNSFLDGGATGISLLIRELTGVNFAVLLLVVNIPFVVLGYTIVGKRFAIKTALAIAGLALVLLFFLTHPSQTIKSW